MERRTRLKSATPGTDERARVVRRVRNSDVLIPAQQKGSREIAPRSARPCRLRSPPFPISSAARRSAPLLSPVHIPLRSPRRACCPTRTTYVCSLCGRGEEGRQTAAARHTMAQMEGVRACSLAMALSMADGRRAPRLSPNQP